MTEAFIVIIALLIIIAFSVGIFKCFARQPVVAVLLLLFFLPGLLIWAFVEMFTG